MKKIILLMSVGILFFTGAMAQDFGFETWGDAVPGFVTVDDPQGWASLNALTAVGTDTSAFKSIIGPAAGTASARIETVKINGASIPNPYGGNLDTAGILTIGKVVIFPAPVLKYGAAYANRPALLTFQSKYSPIGGDSAFVLAYMTRWNGTSRDTLGSGKYGTGATSMSYSTNTLAMNYKPTFMSVMADSQQIFISSSVYSHDGAKIGSTFYIDGLVWSGYVSADDINGVVNNVSIFPNPAISSINLECSVEVKIMKVTDITGRSIGAYNMNDNKVNIQTHSYAPGIYIYNMLNANKELVHRGKFEIIK